MIQLLLSASIALFTYLILPFWGGLRVRRQWRYFRETLQQSVEFQQPRFAGSWKNGMHGLHRFLGRIEALQGDDQLWIRGAQVTLRVQASKAHIYILSSTSLPPSDARALLEERLPEEAPRKISWRQLSSLQEGMQVYAIGSLHVQDDMYGMQGTPDSPLWLILHEGSDVVPRAIWSGRQANEYWNTFTPWSLLIGGLSLLFLTLLQLRSGSTMGMRWSLFMTLFPIYPFLPPGVVFFALYLGNWRRARFLRAERDLLRLSQHLNRKQISDPLTSWRGDFSRDIPSLIQACRRKAFFAELAALLSLLTGLILNAFLVLVVINAMV
ncbi:MAG: hypothetical protein MI717_09200 [Spirochaetales bacterium]|nr:hypothetical protein [Spirochaetales bacterium]